MVIRTIKTHKITEAEHDIFLILQKYLKSFKDESVLVVTSKIVSICEGRVIKVGLQNKQSLVEEESEYYLPPEENKYNFSLTIVEGKLTPAAGIDESNAHGHYILWPKDPQASANNIREYLIKRFRLNKVGVIISDSRTVPLKWGTIGTSLAHSGFKALNDYRMKPDVFGRKLQYTQANIAEALAVAAVVEMGEGAEQTPMAIIENIPFVHFQKRNPSNKELESVMLKPDEDIYAPLLTSIKWRKGKRRSEY